MTTIIKGHIVHAPVFGALRCIENGYIVCEDGVIAGVYETLPPEYAAIPLTDHGDRLIIPSFCDMHLHAPQYAMLGLGMNMQLLEWLDAYTFPTEARFGDEAFARAVYRHLADELVRVGTTRAVLFSSIHRAGTRILMEELQRAGVTGYVGKVNMDRNSPAGYCENTRESIAETERFIEECAGRYAHISPILTPRFTPSCTDELLAALGGFARKYALRVQSHLCENKDEVGWVKSLCPGVKYYYESYARAGLFEENTLMAHCVYVGEEERRAMRARGVWAVHCPDSNVNIISGIAPVRLMLNDGVHVALGSDIAGGAHLSMMRVLTDCIRASKLRYLQSGKTEAFLTVAEAFYLATSAGAAYFNAGPGFLAGDPLHALVLDEGALLPLPRLSLQERLERILYLAPEKSIMVRYSEGTRL